jgi:hypothetical protein
MKVPKTKEKGNKKNFDPEKASNNKQVLRNMEQICCTKSRAPVTTAAWPHFSFPFIDKRKK